MWISFGNPMMIVLTLVSAAIWIAAIVDIIGTPAADWDDGGGMQNFSAPSRRNHLELNQ